MGNGAKRILVGIWVLSFVWGTALAGGAGRTRPGGGGSGGASQPASGRATYGHGGGHGHSSGGYYGGGYYGYGGPYYSGFGFAYSYPYYPYAAWPWGWWYGTWPYRLTSYRIDPSSAGGVATFVEPKKAEVLVDGEYVGQARDYTGRFHLLWMAPGKHVIELRKTGYKTLRRTLDVRPGMQTRLAERMVKGEGLDPRSSEPPALGGGTSKAASTATAVTTEPGAPKGALQRGLLRLDVGPEDAAVYLDGEFLANGRELSRLHGAIPVAQGRHRVEVVRPGYESRTMDVEVDGEDPVRLQIDLEPGD